MTTRALFCFTLLLIGTGCASTDPYQRVGMWRPNYANETNLRRMVAVPADLAHGTGDLSNNGQQAVAALDRLHADKVKQLPDTGLALITLAPSGSNSTGAQ